MEEDSKKTYKNSNPVSQIQPTLQVINIQYDKFLSYLYYIRFDYTYV